MALSTYAKNKLLDHLTGKAEYTMPTLYVGFSTTDPGAEGAGVTEPSGGSYARKATSAATWESAASGAIQTEAAITFDQATGDWGTIGWIVVYDSLSGGNFIGSAAVSSQAVNSGQIAQISAGALDILFSA